MYGRLGVWPSSERAVWLVARATLRGWSEDGGNVGPLVADGRVAGLHLYDFDRSKFWLEDTGERLAVVALDR